MPGILTGMSIHPPTKLLPVGPTARHLRVSVSWLRGEAEANRVPHLRAGDRFLFDLQAVEQVLLERARQQVEGGSS